MMVRDILIVEDVTVLAQELVALLHLFDFDIAGTASSGQEAIDLVRAYKPGLILMNISLPGEFDGIETAVMINEIESIPVVYITGFSDDRTWRRVLQLGHHGFLLRPFTPSDLRAVIEKAFERWDNQISIQSHPLRE